MIIRILFLALIFLGAVFLFDYINQLQMLSKASEIRVNYQEIENFKVVGRTDNNYFLRGKKLIETEKGALILNFHLEYFDKSRPIFIDAETGLYNSKNSFLKLINNVKVRDKDIIMLTDELIINTVKNITGTDKKIIMKSKGSDMITIGKDGGVIFPKERKIKLFNVKTVFIKANNSLY